MLWMVGAPLVGLVKSVASGAGSIASGVAKGIGKAVSGADKEQTAKVAASGAPAGENGENAVIGDESSVSEMFGGLDLTKVKSALEDEGPMGPPEEGPKTVYKVMIGVLQGMAQTLLRMEATMKMLLAIEYERVKGIVAQTAQESITQSKIPDGDEGGGKRGILGRGKDMLGGAWNKAKDSPTWLKMLGLVGLLAAIKFWKEDLEKAVAKILKYLTSAYEYFTAEDFSWDKFKTDMTTKFLPKIRDFIFSVLDWIWVAIKGVVTEWAFGAKGEKRIREESEVGAFSQERLTEMAKGIDTSAPIGTMKERNLNPEVSAPERTAMIKEAAQVVDNMHKISSESNGRIQWTGLDWDMSGLWGTEMSIPLGDILTANPIIDGFEYDSWDILKTLNPGDLAKMGGITKGMSEDKVTQIEEALKEKSMLVSSIGARESDPNFAKRMIDLPFIEPYESKFTAKKNQQAREKLKADKARLLELETMDLGQQFMPTDSLSLDTTVVEKSGSALKDAVKQTPTGLAPPSQLINAPDNSVKTNTTHQTITDLNTLNINPTNILLNELSGYSNTTGVVAT